jgi:hypothetical protein
MVDMSRLDEIAYNHHWHGAGPITREVLEKYYPAMLEELDEVIEQINHVIVMWQDTLNDMKNIDKEE